MMIHLYLIKDWDTPSTWATDNQGYITCKEFKSITTLTQLCLLLNYHHAEQFLSTVREKKKSIFLVYFTSICRDHH